MNFDELYEKHIIQKYRIAVGIAILKTKPRHKAVEEYIADLNTKFDDNMSDLDITICSDDFIMDDDDFDHQIINELQSQDTQMTQLYESQSQITFINDTQNVIKIHTQVTKLNEIQSQDKVIYDTQMTELNESQSQTLLKDYNDDCMHVEARNETNKSKQIERQTILKDYVCENRIGSKSNELSDVIQIFKDIDKASKIDKAKRKQILSQSTFCENSDKTELTDIDRTVCEDTVDNETKTTDNKIKVIPNITNGSNKRNNIVKISNKGNNTSKKAKTINFNNKKKKNKPNNNVNVNNNTQDNTYLDSQAYNNVNINEKFNNTPNNNHDTYFDSQATELYTVHGYTENTHISQSQNINFEISKKYIIGNNKINENRSVDNDKTVENNITNIAINNMVNYSQNAQKDFYTDPTNVYADTVEMSGSKLNSNKSNTLALTEINIVDFSENAQRDFYTEQSNVQFNNNQNFDGIEYQNEVSHKNNNANGLKNYNDGENEVRTVSNSYPIGNDVHSHKNNHNRLQNIGGEYEIRSDRNTHSRNVIDNINEVHIKSNISNTQRNYKDNAYHQFEVTVDPGYIGDTMGMCGELVPKENIKHTGELHSNNNNEIRHKNNTDLYFYTDNGSDIHVHSQRNIDDSNINENRNIDDRKSNISDNANAIHFESDIMNAFDNNYSNYDKNNEHGHVNFSNNSNLNEINYMRNKDMDGHTQKFIDNGNRNEIYFDYNNEHGQINCNGNYKRYESSKRNVTDATQYFTNNGNNENQYKIYSNKIDEARQHFTDNENKIHYDIGMNFENDTDAIDANIGEYNQNIQNDNKIDKVNIELEGSSEDNTDDTQKEIVSFKVIEELNKVRNYLNKKDRRRSCDGSSDSGYRSDSQGRCQRNSLQLSSTWLSQSAHCLYDYITQCPLVANTQEITKEISQVLGQLIDKLHEDETYPTFLEELLEYLNSLLQEIFTADNTLLEKDENIQRFILLNKSIHILKYSIEKITNILQEIHMKLTGTDLYEISNILYIENTAYIFHILEIVINQYIKIRNVYDSTQTNKNMYDSTQSQERNMYNSTQSQEDLKKSDITDIWRKRWNPNYKEDSKLVETQKICVLAKCSEILNKIVIDCMDGYSLVSFAALQCFNLLQS